MLIDGPRRVTRKRGRYAQTWADPRVFVVLLSFAVLMKFVDDPLEAAQLRRNAGLNERVCADHFRVL